MFRPRTVGSPPGSSRSRISDRAPVQSTRMSPGSSSSRSPRRRRPSPATRSTVPVPRDSISSLSVRSIVLSGHEPARPRLEQRAQVGRDGPPVGQPRLELERVEDRLDALPVDRVRLVALDRVGDQVVGQRHHPGPRVRRHASRTGGRAGRRSTGGGPPGTGRPAPRRRRGRDRSGAPSPSSGVPSAERTPAGRAGSLGAAHRRDGSPRRMWAPPSTWRASDLVCLVGLQLPVDRIDQPAPPDLRRPRLSEPRRVRIAGRRSRAPETQVLAHLAQACRIVRWPPVVHTLIADRERDVRPPSAAPGACGCVPVLPAARSGATARLEWPDTTSQRPTRPT